MILGSSVQPRELVPDPHSNCGIYGWMLLAEDLCRAQLEVKKGELPGWIPAFQGCDLSQVYFRKINK